jgi:hypothetical protein
VRIVDDRGAPVAAANVVITPGARVATNIPPGYVQTTPTIAVSTG